MSVVPTQKQTSCRDRKLCMFSIVTLYENIKVRMGKKEIIYIMTSIFITGTVLCVLHILFNFMSNLTQKKYN